MGNDEIYETKKCIEALNQFVLYTQETAKSFGGYPYTISTVSKLQESLDYSVRHMNDIIAAITGWYGRINCDYKKSEMSMNCVPCISLEFIKPPYGHLSGNEFMNLLSSGKISILKEAKGTPRVEIVSDAK